MDPSNKLTELSNTIYMLVARELSSNGIPATLGLFVVDSVYRRICDDALTVVTMRNNNLESELAKKMQELEELKTKLNCTASDNNVSAKVAGGLK